MIRKLLALVALALIPVYSFADGAPAAIYRLDAANTNNSTLIKAGVTVVKSIISCGGTATLHYVKFYNKATAPTCGTDVPSLVITSGVTTAPSACVPVPLPPEGIQFELGLGVCVVTGVTDADNTSATVHGSLLTVGYR